MYIDALASLRQAKSRHYLVSEQDMDMTDNLQLQPTIHIERPIQPWR